MSHVSSYAGPTPALQKHHTLLEFRLFCGLQRITIVILILCSLLNESLSVRFEVSSAESVSVTVGSDVVLPCCLTPEMNAENMEIRWFKSKFKPCVHLYYNGKDDYTDQMPEFTERTELIKENMTRGVLLLKIHKVTVQDSGEYHCFAGSSEHHESAIVQLLIKTETIENGSPEKPRFSQHIIIIIMSVLPIVAIVLTVFLKKIYCVKWRKNARQPQPYHISCEGLEICPLKGI